MRKSARTREAARIPPTSLTLGHRSPSGVLRLPDTESLRTVDTHIARLRKKLGWTDKQIETVFKIGYRLRKE